MKKILFALIILLISCSKDTTEVVPMRVIPYPNWIFGSAWISINDKDTSFLALNKDTTAIYLNNKKVNKFDYFEIQQDNQYYGIAVRIDDKMVWNQPFNRFDENALYL